VPNRRKLVVLPSSAIITMLGEPWAATTTPRFVLILTEPRYAAGVAFGMKGDLGIVPLDA
jgi:hypothetical protein